MGKIKEFFRKLIVSLKRNPGIIPLLMLAVSFLFYSLNLTDVSDTTAKIQSRGMGLSEFTIMLFSMLVAIGAFNWMEPIVDKLGIYTVHLGLVVGFLATVLLALVYYLFCYFVIRRRLNLE